MLDFKLLRLGHPRALLLTLGLLGFLIFNAQPGQAQTTPTNNDNTYNLTAASSIATGHTASVVAAAFSPDGHYLASVSADTLLRVWRLAGSTLPPQPVCTFYNYPAALVSFGWSPDGQVLATGDSNGGLKLWSLDCGKLAESLPGPQGSVRTLAFSPDGRWLASGGSDNVLRVWEVASRRAVLGYDNGRAGINSLKWSPDSSHIAFVATDGQVSLLDFQGKDSRLQKAVNLGTSPLRSLAWSGDGQWLAAGNSAGLVSFLGSSDLSLKTSLKVAGPEITIHSLAFTPDNSRLAVGTSDNAIKVWSFDSTQAQTGTVRQFVGHFGPVRSVSFSPDGKILLTASDDRTVRLWDVIGGTQLPSLDGGLAYQTGVGWSPDGSHLVSGANDGRVRVWQATTGLLQTSLTATSSPTETVRATVLSPNGRWLAGGGENGALTIWPWLQGQLAPSALPVAITGLPTNSGGYLALAFSPDSKTLVSAGQDGRLRLWKSVANGWQLAAMSQATTGRAIRALAFVPTGDFIASGGDDGKIRLWNSSNLQVRSELSGHVGYLKTLAFDRSGATLASAGGDGTVRLWDVKSGQTRQVAGLGGPVKAMALSDDGGTVAAATSEGAIRVYNAADSRLYLTISGHGLAATGLTFRPGRADELAAVTQDGALQVWNLKLSHSASNPMLTAPVQPAPSPQKEAQFVQATPDHLSLAGQPVILKGFNFYPHAAPWAALWKHWNGQQFAADLDRAAELGSNSLRILVPYGQNYDWTTPDGTPAADMLDELDQLIGLASQRNMRVLLTLFDFYGEFPLAGTGEEEANFRYLDALVNHYQGDPRVIGWDLHNEPDNYALWQTGRNLQVIDWLARMAQRVRLQDPNHWLTVGFGNWQNLSLTDPDGLSPLALVDTVALHAYDPGNIGQQVQDVRAAGGGNLPVFLEEFGWPSGPVGLNDVYNEPTQLDHFKRVLGAIQSSGLDGGLAWMLNDVSYESILHLTPLDLQFFGLLREDATLKPAAAFFQAAYPSTNLALPPAALPPLPTLTVREVDLNNYGLYFPQTGFVVPTPFKEYWNREGGLDSFGYPLSGVLAENGLLVQYFERARFEYHPEATNTPDYGTLTRSQQLERVVLLGLLTDEGLSRQGRHFKGATALPGQQYFELTRHNLGGRFAAYWSSHGGLARFGYPLSEEIEEVSPTDGKTYRVQYFERGRFEYHPELAGTPYEVELGQLGREALPAPGTR